MKLACELICMALCLFAVNGFSDLVNLGATVTNENMDVVGTVATTNIPSKQCCSDDGSAGENAGKPFDYFEDCGTKTNDNVVASFEMPHEEVADVNLSLTAKLVDNFVVAGKSTPISSVYKNSESESLAFAAYVNGLMTYRGSADDSVIISFNPEWLITRHSEGAKFGAVTVLFSIKYEF